jgi:hypothetical protein
MLLLGLVFAPSRILLASDLIGGESFAIPDDQIPTFKMNALLGNPEAAHKLTLYYRWFHVNRTDELYWTTIAAENGSPDGEYDLGFVLAEDPSQKNIRRAEFWLNKAKAAGVMLAASLLDELTKSGDLPPGSH